MTDDVLRFLKRHLPPRARVICAVSGGPDSMALLRAVHMLQNTLRIDLRCAHFNHRLRGEESDGDEAFVRDFCAQHNIPFVRASGDAARAADAAGESLEQAARRLRYGFLLSIDPDAFILTAHTADDNLETMLMHLLRGASLRGLAGIPPVRGRILRPLLTCTRADVMAFLSQSETPCRLDRTNDDDDCLRNRLRHHVVPLLRAENPSVAESAQIAAQRMREEDALLDELAAQALASARTDGGLSCAALRAQPRALLRRIVRQHLCERGALELSGRHIEAVCALALSDDPSARISLPGGLQARREYDALRVEPARPAPGGFQPVPLQIPGVTALPALGLRISCQIADFSASGDIPCTFAVHYTGAGVVIRPRRQGDAMRLHAGTRSLKKLMIDRKVPAGLRDSVPLFADDGGVLAVMGIGVNLDRLPQAGRPALYIQIEKDGVAP